LSAARTTNSPSVPPARVIARFGTAKTVPFPAPNRRRPDCPVRPFPGGSSAFTTNVRVAGSTAGTTSETVEAISRSGASSSATRTGDPFFRTGRYASETAASIRRRRGSSSTKSGTPGTAIDPASAFLSSTTPENGAVTFA